MRRCLITGATGFIGPYLLRELAGSATQRHFVALCRDRGPATRLQAFLGPQAHTIEVLEGDITKPRLGLSERDRVRLRDLDECWHLAALTSFSPDDPRVVDVNVAGTRRVLEEMTELGRRVHVFHFSTAYAGRPAQGTVRRVLPISDPIFLTRYEETKHQAEQEVRNSGLAFTVFRPSIVVAPADDDAPQFGDPAIYTYLGFLCDVVAREAGGQYFERLRRGDIVSVRIRLIGRNSTRKNFICVDDLTARIRRITEGEPTDGIFHLVNPEYITLGSLCRSFERALGVEGIEYCGATVPDPSGAERTFQRLTSTYHRYALTDDPEWETVEIESVTPQGGVSGDVQNRLVQRFVRRRLAALESRLGRRWS